MDIPFDFGKRCLDVYNHVFSVFDTLLQVVLSVLETLVDDGVHDVVDSTSRVYTNNELRTEGLKYV